MKRWRWLLAVALLLGGALRLYHASSLYRQYLPHVDQEEGYYEAGMALLSGHTLGLIPDFRPSAFRAPFYPAFIALVESPWTHPHPGHVRLAQVAVSCLDVALVFGLATAIASPWAGVAAAAWTALELEQILGVSALNVHGFYAFPILALCAALLIWLERRGAAAGCLLGFMLGVSLLTRSAHFPFPLMFAGAYLFWWKFPESLAVRFRRLALVGGVTLLTLSPMIARNYVQFKKFILLDSHKGSYILLTSSSGPHLTTTVDQALDVAESIEPGFRARNLSGGELHGAMLSLALRNMRAHPLDYAWYCVQRFFLFWGGLWLPWLLALAALMLDRDNKRLQAAALVAASFSGYAIAGGAPEYRAAVVPALLALAGCGLAALARRFGWGGQGQPAPTGLPVFLTAFGVLGVVYAVLTGFLFLEVKDRRLGLPENPRVHADGRANEVLKLAVDSTTRGGAALDAYLNALVHRCAALTKLGDYEGARRDLAEARRRLPLADPVLRRSVAQRLEFSSLQLQARTSGLTEGDLRRASLASADAVTAGRRAAWVHVKAGRSKEALVLADGLVRALSKEAPGLRSRALVVRGQLFLEMQSFDKAEKDLKGALALDGGNEEARVLLGGVLFHGGRLAQALEFLKGSSAERFALRSLILGRMGRVNESGAELKKALAIDPVKACGSLPGVDRSGVGTAFYDACLALLPGDASLLVDRGVARFIGKDLKGAEADFRSALKRMPDSLEAAVSLASLLEGSGRRAEALPVVEGALKVAGARKGEPVYARAASLRDGLR